jgi:hypothetical protein
LCFAELTPSPLQAEIDRLVDGCSQHELRFRSARVRYSFRPPTDPQASFDHRVFTEFPSLLNELNEIDDRAERITAKLYTAIKDSKPRLQLRLDSIVQQGEETVLKMQKRTTPWRSLIAKGEAEEEKAAPNAAEAQGEDEKETGVSEGTASATSSRKSSLVAYGGVGLQRTRSGDRRSIARIERIANGSTPNPDDRAIAYMQEQWGTDTVSRPQVYGLADTRSSATAARSRLSAVNCTRRDTAASWSCAVSIPLASSC